jgi:hypothetical protein
MNYEDIKTYAERCEKFEGIVTHQMVEDCLLDAITTTASRPSFSITRKEK